MGVSIRVYTDIKETNEEESDFRAFTLEGFEDRIKNLKFNSYYKGKYEGTFISYPCSSHNIFRQNLAILIDKPKGFWYEYDYHTYRINKNVPFYELFEFADNEGCIDYESSEELYKDFNHYKNIAKDQLSNEIFEYYEEWLNIFSIARNKGVVVFR